MKNVIITGSSGMVGKLVLQECLSNPNIKSVTSLVRHSCEMNHEKLTEIIGEDFLDYSKYERNFKNLDIAYYCLGVYSGSVPREEFKRITVDYTIAFVDMLVKHNPNAVFCFLSGQGADQKEKSKMMFAKDKGAAENYLLRTGLKVYTFRPAYIYPVTPRKEPNFTYKSARMLYPLLKVFFSNGVITSEQLAKAMFITGIKGNDKVILENKDIFN